MKQTLARIAHRADRFCARINGGLTAVAIVLALLTTAVLIGRLPALFPPAQADAAESPTELP